MRRQFFELLSKEMLVSVKRYGQSQDEPLYRAHCPMAFNDRGADWLQRGKEIHNPYFGAAMLKCGEIKATFAPHGPKQKTPAPKDDGKHGANEPKH